MISVKGKFQNGVALPLEHVKDSREGQTVIITFLEENGTEVLAEKTNGIQSSEDLLAK